MEDNALPEHRSRLTVYGSSDPLNLTHMTRSIEDTSKGTVGSPPRVEGMLLNLSGQRQPIPGV